jgi:hypothetical protein
MLFYARKSAIQKELLLLRVLPGVKQWGIVADQSTSSGTEIIQKSLELYPHSSVRLCGILCN